MPKKFLTLFLLLTPLLFAEPRMILHFDINSTLILPDHAKGRTAQETLNEKLKECPSKRALAEEKLKRQQTLVFPSFYRLIDHLERRGIPYTIVLRTFGRDLRPVMTEIHHLRPHIVFMTRGHFQNETLIIKGGHLRGPKAFFRFLKKSGHAAIQDDYFWWRCHGRKSRYGKPFPFNRQDPETISLFFDDHADRLVGPFDLTHNQWLETKIAIREGLLFPVDTIEALINDDYYIGLLQIR